MRRERISKYLNDFGDMPVLITGGKGMLGNSFLTQLKEYRPDLEVKALGKEELDVTNREQVLAQKEWLNEGWIIHCAAKVNVEFCAKEKDLARKIIVGGTQNVIELAQQTQSKIFYPQSFLIYNCEVTPVSESAPPTPLAYYGELKAEAESLILNSGCEHLSVRMAGFFGGEQRDKNFVGKIIQHIHGLIDSKQSTIEIGDRVWQPTWTDDLADNSLVLMASGQRGVMQMACHGTASFYELAKAIAEELNWHKHIEIVQVSANDLSINEVGKRPDSAELSCSTLRESGLDLQRDWRDTLKIYLKNEYFDQYRR